MTITPSEQGRALAALRPRTTAICEVCGAEFETWARKTQQARTCSPKCRQKLWRREKNAAATRIATRGVPAAP